MKVFLSHKSRDKPTIDVFRDKLPTAVKTWLDIEQIEWGGDLAEQLQGAIRSEVDFLLIFLAYDTLNSEWVKRELGWALEREKELARTFVLPILLERDEENVLQA